MLRKLIRYIMSTCSPGVSSFSVIANEVKLYRVRLGGGLLLFHSKDASEEEVQSLGLPLPSLLT